MYRVNEFSKEKKYIKFEELNQQKKFFEKKGFQVLNGGRWFAKDLKN